jgi:prepilin-type N-terminal cleavage/methylation domain-containing protein
MRFGEFRRSIEDGFSLIEILIVVAVLGVLAAVVIPSISTFSTSASVAAANSEVENVYMAALAYQGSTSEWPEDTTTTGFNDFIEGELRATYSFDNNGQITGVDTTTVEKPWPSTIEFDADSQQWGKAAAISSTPTVPATTTAPITAAATTIPGTKTVAPTTTAATTIPSTKTVAPTEIVKPTTVVEPTKTTATPSGKTKVPVLPVEP